MDNLFQQIISLENLFFSWKEFRRSKRKKIDVQEFERNLEDNLFSLHFELKNKTYQHANYTSFYIIDPKSRHINKACVRDRIVHHAIYRVLYPIFDKGFIDDSYSCRNKKGTHKAVKRLEKFARIVSHNYTKPCWALKCDIEKYFASIDHKILLAIIRKKIQDDDSIWLLKNIINSFPVQNQIERERERESKISSGNFTQYSFWRDNRANIGIPIGNLTSQLFANVYLNELDQFVKQRLRTKNYLRYCDDFIFVADNIEDLTKLIPQINNFLKNNLKLSLHPNKIIIRKLRQGIDFLGYVTLPYYRVLRTKTKRRMLTRINEKNSPSYLGFLKHCEGYELEKKIRNLSQ